MILDSFSRQRFHITTQSGPREVVGWTSLGWGMFLSHDVWCICHLGSGKVFRQRWSKIEVAAETILKLEEESPYRHADQINSDPKVLTILRSADPEPKSNLKGILNALLSS